MRECLLVSPADVMKVTVVNEGGGLPPRIALFTTTTVDWLTSDVVAGIVKQIHNRVRGLQACTFEIMPISKGAYHLWYVSVCLPEGSSRRKVRWFYHEITRVIKDQPTRKVPRKPARKGSSFVNDRVRIATAP